MEVIGKSQINHEVSKNITKPHIDQSIIGSILDTNQYISNIFLHLPSYYIMAILTMCKKISYNQRYNS